jgi:hypothetical protein
MLFQSSVVLKKISAVKLIFGLTAIPKPLVKIRYTQLNFLRSLIPHILFSADQPLTKYFHCKAIHCCRVFIEYVL